MRATSVVVSTQHDEGLSQDDVRALVRPFVENVLPDGWMCPEEAFYVNPTGTFVIGGPDGDAGLTGRKIIVDTYGGAAPHGGGAFSGKDPTKVDRSAAHASRYLAKMSLRPVFPSAAPFSFLMPLVSRPVDLCRYAWHGHG